MDAHQLKRFATDTSVENARRHTASMHIRKRTVIVVRMKRKTTLLKNLAKYSWLVYVVGTMPQENRLGRIELDLRKTFDRLSIDFDKLSIDFRYMHRL